MLVILFSESLNRICHLSHHQRSSVKLNNITFLASSALLVIPANSLTWMVVSSLSHVQLFVTLQTVVHQTPLSMGFSRQESWSGFPFPSPGDFLSTGIEPRSPTLQEDSPTELQGKPILFLPIFNYKYISFYFMFNSTN